MFSQLLLRERFKGKRQSDIQLMAQSKNQHNKHK